MLSTMTERFIWSVTYRDGTTFEEYPDPDTHHGFGEVQVGDVVQLHLKPNHWLGIMGGQTFTVVCNPDEGTRPVMFRTVRLDVQSGESVRWHVFGVQRTLRGKNVKSLLYLLDSGEGPVVLTPERMEIA